MQVLLTIVNGWHSSTIVRKSSILNFEQFFCTTICIILTIIENKSRKTKIGNFTRVNQKIVLLVNYAVWFITSHDKLIQIVVDCITKLYNICFDALLLGKQDSINQKRLLDDYCEIIEAWCATGKWVYQLCQANFI